jgi:DNA polymerase-3 subunit gamma/tau
VSFTNGELTYANSLEHLNILDADYYFKLLDCMQQQDLAGAMLLYDDINRKGFEGDLVLNGFAEFIRNLLVCKDERVAGLLEVVEAFKEKYIATGKKTSAATLISTLNILNEAEINYRSARNKRLHVELAIIKLCYLQQALELSADASGISKKKLTDTVRPVAFRQITPIEVRSRENGVGGRESGVIASEAKQAGRHYERSEASQGDAKLIIENPKVNKPAVKNETPVVQPTASVKTTTQGSKITALDKIRKQYQDNSNTANGNINHALELEQLQKAWGAYIVKLKEAKSSAVQSFELALLRIKDENSFEAVTANNIEQKFIEQERNRLFQFLQQQLQNRLLQFNVVVEENTHDRPKIEIPLNAKEQFLKMAEQYPLVKEFKDRLKLDLDY